MCFSKKKVQIINLIVFHFIVIRQKSFNKLSRNEPDSRGQRSNCFNFIIKVEIQIRFYDEREL